MALSLFASWALVTRRITGYLETWVAYHRNEVFEKRLEGRSPLDYLIEKLESLLAN